MTDVANEGQKVNEGNVVMSHRIVTLQVKSLFYFSAVATGILAL